MVNRAISKTRRTQQESQFLSHWRKLAADDYREQLERKEKGLEFLGAEKTRQKWMERCKRETGKDILINKQTLINHAKGGSTKAESNAKTKSWLTYEESETVIAYIIEIGLQGFPLSHRRLKEHVDEILCGRLGDDFPGVGKNWTSRFIEKWSSRIRTAWSTPLEEKRGQAVNIHVHQAWSDLLGERLQLVDDDLIYGTDEFGTNGVVGQRERVIGSSANKLHYQQVGGSRENITVIVTICADGTTTPPAVIFKGKAFQVRWKQSNPANAMIGHSVKGWTNGEIGIAWIKQFEEFTRRKANNRRRLLLVDGHNSHYTRGFLEYAREHNIDILCYPAHTTHVYQGLDVAVFSSLKRALREERDSFERRTGKKFGKDNFLEIYGNAQNRALTPETIKSAFRATGVVPFNMDVITTEKLAPSKDTSAISSLPIVPPTPVRLVAQMLRESIGLHVKDDLPFDDNIDTESDIEVGGDEPSSIADDDPFTDSQTTGVPADISVYNNAPMRYNNMLEPIQEEHDNDEDSNSAPETPSRPAVPLPTLDHVTHTPRLFITPRTHSQQPQISATTSSSHHRLITGNTNIDVVPGLSPLMEPSVPVTVLHEINEAVQRLAESTLASLVKAFDVPGPDPRSRQQIAVSRKPILPTLDFQPRTKNEKALAAAILKLEEENSMLRRRAIELQAANILNEAYCTVLREQLAFKNKKEKTKTATGRLMGDGMPVLLSGDDFYNRVIEWEKQQEQQEADKKERRAAKATRDSKMGEYHRKCEERKQEIERIKQRWEEAKQKWTEDKEKWKSDKAAGLNVPARWTILQPKRGPLPKAIPRPTARKPAADSSNDSSNADGEDGEIDDDTE